jgi:hypothetical protein
MRLSGQYPQESGAGKALDYFEASTTLKMTKNPQFCIFNSSAVVLEKKKIFISMQGKAEYSMTSL